MNNISENTKVPLGKAIAVAIGVSGAVWWAATLTANVSTMKGDIASIKAVIAPDRFVLSVKNP